MFCHKCGRQIADGSHFCHYCGAQLTPADSAAQPSNPSAAENGPGEAGLSAEPGHTQTYSVPSGTQKKKKSKILPIILGAAAALIVVVIVIAVNSEQVDDYIENGGVKLVTTSSKEVTLSETYTDDTAGISFQYPDGWVVLDSGGEYTIVEMIDSKNRADSNAKLHVNIIYDQDPYGVFTQDEAAVRETVNENDTFIKLGDTMIGDVPVKGLTYQTAGLKGDDIVSKFWYIIGEDIYQITCSYSASMADTYEPVFAAIMDSYAIAGSAGGAAEASEDVDSDVSYYVEYSESYSEGYEPTVMLYQDGRFNFYANVSEGMELFYGTYSVYEDSYIFRVAETQTHVDFEFSMRLSGDALIFEGLDPLGMTMYGAVFSLSAAPPKSVMDAGNGEEIYGDEVPYGYEGEEEAYDYAQGTGFQRSDYFTGITYIDLLRYPDSYYGSKLYFPMQVVTDIMEPKVYLVKGEDFSGNDGKYFIFDDRYNTGANAVKGDRVAAYGSFTEVATVNFTDGRSEQVPVITADRFIVNTILPDIEELAQALVEAMNSRPYAFGNNSKYISGSEVQLVMGVYGSGESKSITIYDGNKTNLSSLSPRSIGDVDGYSVTMNPQLSPDLISPRDAGVVLSDDPLETTPIRVNGTITSMKQNSLAPYIIEITFNIESFEPY